MGKPGDQRRRGKKGEAAGWMGELRYQRRGRWGGDLPHDGLGGGSEMNMGSVA